MITETLYYSCFPSFDILNIISNFKLKNMEPVIMVVTARLWSELCDQFSFFINEHTIWKLDVTA